MNLPLSGLGQWTRCSNPVLQHLNSNATQLGANRAIQSEVAAFHATALEVGGQQYGKQSVISLYS